MSNLKNISVQRHDGVVVLGGGVSGCAAAISAARSGGRVLLAESSITLGGMASSGLVANWNGHAPGRHPLTEELVRRCLRESATFPGSSRCISAEAVALALEEWLAELGVELLYECSVADVLLDGARVVGVYLKTPSGLLLLEAPLFIDATGDGAAACAAGVPFTLGREQDGLCQGASLLFQIDGISPDVDIASLPQNFNQSYSVSGGDLCELARRELPPPLGHVLLHPTAEPGVCAANMTNAVRFDPTDPRERSRAIRECRRQQREIIRFLRRHLPGFEHCMIRRSASQFGIRECRHFHGRQTLTEQDILQGRVFPDWISTGNRFCLDVHNVNGSGLDEHGVLACPSKGYTVPLMACVPVNREGLLLCGRAISGSHVAHGSFRVMPICMNIGLGVGVAAALMTRHGQSAAELSLDELHEELIRHDVAHP